MSMQAMAADMRNRFVVAAVLSVPILLWSPIGRSVLGYFQDLKQRYPETFDKYYGEASREKCAEALRLGRRVYIGEACWHCHSQFVRPVSNEDRRWGPVSRSWEYQNELQRPVMFGTRRVAGKGTLTLAVNASGDSILGFAQTLNGSATLSAKQGAIVGYNVEQLLRRHPGGIRYACCAHIRDRYRGVDVSMIDTRTY